MKLLAAVAVTVAAAATVSAQVEDSNTIPFAQEPGQYAPDATIPFVDEPGFSDAETIRSLDFDELKTNEILHDGERELLVAETVIAFQIGSMAAPIIADIIKGKKKECQQVACYIATPSRTCAISVAERVQNEVTQGRDRFRYESFNEGGMWARYWRTKFEPADRGEVASGNCTDGVAFSVTNCQSTGRVHC